MNKPQCFLTRCPQPCFTNSYYCLTHYLKLAQQNGYVRCSYCYHFRIPVNKNYYLQNRYQSHFWNAQERNKFICFSCLYDWQEIKVPAGRKTVYRVYKHRYYVNNPGTPLRN